MRTFRPNRKRYGRFSAVIALIGLLLATASAGVAAALPQPVTDYDGYPPDLPASCYGALALEGVEFTVDGRTGKSLRSLNADYGDEIKMTWTGYRSGCEGLGVGLSVKRSESTTFDQNANQELITFDYCGSDTPYFGCSGPFELTINVPAATIAPCFQLDAHIGPPLAVVGPEGKYYSFGNGPAAMLISAQNGGQEPCVAVAAVTTTPTTAAPTTTTAAPTTTTTAAPTTTTTAAPTTTTTAAPTTTTAAPTTTTTAAPTTTTTAAPTTTTAAPTTTTTAAPTTTTTVVPCSHNSAVPANSTSCTPCSTNPTISASSDSCTVCSHNPNVPANSTSCNPCTHDASMAAGSPDCNPCAFDEKLAAGDAGCKAPVVACGDGELLNETTGVCSKVVIATTTTMAPTTTTTAAPTTTIAAPAPTVLAETVEALPATLPRTGPGSGGDMSTTLVLGGLLFAAGGYIAYLFRRPSGTRFVKQG